MFKLVRTAVVQQARQDISAVPNNTVSLQHSGSRCFLLQPSVWSSSALNNMGDGTSVQSLLQNLSEHIQEHKAVTYKWFAREYSLPANYAKQLLFRFVEEQGSKIRAVYAVSGCAKADNDQQQHIVRLVDSSQLESCRGDLQEGTISMHIHRWGWPQQQHCLHVCLCSCFKQACLWFCSMGEGDGVL